MKIHERILKESPWLEPRLRMGYGFAVTYDSLFRHNFVLNMFDAQILRQVYSQIPWRLREVKAVAKTRDGNFWFCHETKELGLVWIYDGNANTRLKKTRLE